MGAAIERNIPAVLMLMQVNACMTISTLKCSKQPTSTWLP